MHQNSSFSVKKSKKNSEDKITKTYLVSTAQPPSQTPPPVGRGTPPPHALPSSAPRLVPIRRSGSTDKRKGHGTKRYRTQRQDATGLSRCDRTTIRVVLKTVEQIVLYVSPVLVCIGLVSLWSIFQLVNCSTTATVGLCIGQVSSC